MGDIDTAPRDDFLKPRIFRTIAPDRVISGRDVLAHLPKILGKMRPGPVLIATSNSVANRTPLLSQVTRLISDGRVLEVFDACRQHSPESDIVAVAELLREKNIAAVVSIGGSSVFDTIKVASSRAAGEQGVPVRQVAVPTTLSAGEFTPGAGYTAADTGHKQLVLDPRVVPGIIPLDPEATVHTPRDLWLSTGIKALDHAIETVWAFEPHPFSDTLALRAIELLYRNLAASAEQSALEARAACQMAAWMSIAGVGAVGMRLSHFMGHQIGAVMHLPHGVTSCVTLPTVMRYLAPQTLAAQVLIAKTLGVDTAFGEKSAHMAADAIEAFIADMGLPTRIGEAGGDRDELDRVVGEAMRAATQLGLLRDLPGGEADMRRLLELAW